MHNFSTNSFSSSSKTIKTDSPGRDAKRRKFGPDEINEDISQETVAEIVAVIDNPNFVTGPDVCFIFKIPTRKISTIPMNLNF